MDRIVVLARCGDYSYMYGPSINLPHSKIHHTVPHPHFHSPDINTTHLPGTLGFAH